MPRRPSWKDLPFGLAALAVIVGGALAILLFARIGTLHGSTIRLYAQTGEARGLIRGSEVWLSGQKVGVVKDIQFLPPTVDPRGRVLIAMDVLDEARGNIRHDSHAQIRAGGTLIGAPVVYISIGTSRSPAAREGDTIRALPQTDFENMASDFALATRNFPDLIANVKLLNAQLHSAEGTLGALGIEKAGPQLITTHARLARLATQLERPTGTIGSVLSERSPLTARAQVVMARADSVRELIASKRTSYGRFRRDSTLLREVADIRNEIDIVRARAASPNGTLGRARADSAVFDALAGVHREMSLLFADLRRRPLRYVRF
jgi:ABC-type transporter Mla subunit MlaD